MAPEVLKRKYLGRAADLFACAVTLFVMHAGNYPWDGQVSIKNGPYSLLAQKKYEEFWEFQERSNPMVNFSEDFKSLVTMMIEPSPQDRICMSDVIAHSWLQGPTATNNDIKSEMMNRRQILA